MKVVVVHMLHDGLLLCGIDIDALILLVNGLSKFSLDLSHCQLILVEAFLLLSDLVHI
jgi:hypothetical protein